MPSKILEAVFDFNHFLTHNSFDLTFAQIEQFKHQTDEILAGLDKDETTLYACYFDGFWIELILNDTKKTMIEQTQIINVSQLKHPQLVKLLDFTKLELSNIKSVYGDKDERVIILNNGVMLYFNFDENGILLSRLVSKHKPSKKLVKQSLYKLVPNKKTKRAIKELENYAKSHAKNSQ